MNNRRSALKVAFQSGDNAEPHVIIDDSGIKDMDRQAPPFINVNAPGKLQITGFTGVLEAGTPTPSIDLIISSEGSFRSKLSWSGRRTIEEQILIKIRS